MERINILGVFVNCITKERVNEFILDSINNEEKHLILNVNINCLNLSFGDIELRKILNNASIVFCDGIGVKIAAKLMGKSIPERITYADWMWNLSEFAEKNYFSLFFLGAKEGIAEKAAIKLKESFPKLDISGTHHGYFNKEDDSKENINIIKMINKKKPDILIVSFGMPLQEKWLKNNWSKIDAHIGLTGGAAFNYVSGETKRGPKWLTDYGFEWLIRLIFEPRRLWKRYIIGNPLFFFRILKCKIFKNKYHKELRL